MKLHQLVETKRLTIDDLLSKEEQHVEFLVKNNKSTHEMEDKVRRKLKSMGHSSVNNIGVFLKFVNDLKNEHLPDVVKDLPTPTISGELKAREKALKNRLEKGLSPYTGD